MSCVHKNTNVEIELESSENDTLIRAYKILKNIADDMWTEDLEDTEDAFKVTEARDSLKRFLDYMGIVIIELG